MAKSAGRSQSAKPAASSGPSRGRDIVQVIVMGLVFTLIFTAVAIGASYAIGVKPASNTSGQQVNNPGSTQVAVIATDIPTAVPTATEIPCEAPAWWGEHRTAVAQLVNNITNLAINTPPGNINATAEQLKTWNESFAAALHPPCIASAQQALTAFVPKGEAYINAYLSVTTPQQRALALIDALNALLPAADALTSLQLADVNVPDDQWIGKVQNFFTGECLAAKWYAEIMVGRDYYERFAIIRREANLQSPSIDTLTQMRDLSSAFRTDSTTFPECVQAAAAHFQTALDGFFNGLNQILNNNLTDANNQLANSTAELNIFVSDVEALIPSSDTYPAIQPA